MCDKAVDLGVLPNGYHLYRKPNKAGGYTYYSDEIGGGVMVWDTCLVQECTLLAAIVAEYQRKYLERIINDGWRPQNKDILNDKTANTGAPFIPLDIQEMLKNKIENDN